MLCVKRDYQKDISIKKENKMSNTKITLPIQAIRTLTSLTDKNVKEYYGYISCKDLAEAKITIQEKHGEQIVFRGISARGHVTFIFLNDTSGTWTAAIVRPEASQQLCWVDSGSTGEVVKKKDEIKW